MTEISKEARELAFGIIAVAEQGRRSFSVNATTEKVLAIAQASLDAAYQRGWRMRH